MAFNPNYFNEHDEPIQVIGRATDDMTGETIIVYVDERNAMHTCSLYRAIQKLADDQPRFRKIEAPTPETKVINGGYGRPVAAR